MIRKSAAIVTIHKADDMTPEGRKALADWLRKTAGELEKFGSQYSKRFTGRYLYEADEPRNLAHNIQTGEALL